MNVRACLLSSAILGGAAGCGPSERPPHAEAETRTVMPVPACVSALVHRSQPPGTMRNLSEDEVWKVVFPRYDASAHRLPADAVACNGERLFDQPVFAGGRPHEAAGGSGGGIHVQEGDVAFGNMGDRIRIVWLRTHTFQDGSEAGPVAMLRAYDDFAEVYAVGVHRRTTRNMTLGAERLGPEVLVSITDDGCEGKAKTDPCSSLTALYSPRFGRLPKVATLLTEKRAYASGNEPGVSGQLEYELTASPEYSAQGVRVVEQVQATDAAGRALRKTELERMLVFRDGALEGPSESLWERVYPSSTSEAPRARSPVPPEKPR